MSVPNARHDPHRFYHCECLDEGAEHDQSRFYHCDCLEGGYDPATNADVAYARARESNSPDDHEAAADAFDAAGMFITARLARNTAARLRSGKQPKP